MMGYILTSHSVTGKGTKGFKNCCNRGDYIAFPGRINDSTTRSTQYRVRVTLSKSCSIFTINKWFE